MAEEVGPATARGTRDTDDMLRSVNSLAEASPGGAPVCQAKEPFVVRPGLESEIAYTYSVTWRVSTTIDLTRGVRLTLVVGIDNTVGDSLGSVPPSL